MLKTKFYEFLAAAVLTGVLGLMGCVSGGGDVTCVAPAVLTAGVCVTPPAPLAVLPETASVVPGTPTVFTITGGVKNYSVFSDNSAVISFAGSAVSGNTFVVNAANVFVDTLVTLSVTDSVNTKVDIKVTVKAPSSSPLAVSPATASGTVGQVLSFVVTGGVPSYAVTSNNPSIAGVSSASSSGGPYIFTATLKGAGINTLVLTDSNKNDAIQIPVTVSSVALSTTVPRDVSIQVGETTSGDTIGGGTAPYTAFSGDKSVATVSVSGATLAITGVASGVTSIVIRDETRTEVEITVTVKAPSSTPLAVFPTTPSGTVGEVLNFVVTGGIPGYAVTSSNRSISDVSLVGSVGGQYIFTATLKGAGINTLVLTDSNKTVISITVTVGNGAATPLYTSVPAAVTLQVSGFPTGYTIGGGTAPYTATSDNTSVATASVSGSTLNITGVAAGKANIDIRDANGSLVTRAVTVGTVGGASTPLYTTAPGAVTIAVGGTPNYTIAGGTAPYSVSSSNSAVASVVVNSPSFTITGVAAGPANIVVRDSTGGAPVTIVVTVASSAGAALYTTSPLAITIAAIGTPGAQTYTIGGGTAPYTVTSDNTNVASITGSSGTTLKITGVADGKANILVQDATGSASVKIAVNVATGAGFTVIGSAPTWTISGNGDTILSNDCHPADPSPFSVYFINGGTPPYTVSSTSPLVGTIIGTNTSSVADSTKGVVAPTTAQSVLIKDWPVQSGGYFVVAWPNANNNCASGEASFKVLDSTGLVPALTPTFKVTFSPS